MESDSENLDPVSGDCDKCGKPVPRSNDATWVESLALGDSLVVYESGQRHFLPTPDCEGSPSRAQYLEGQPRDPRPGAEYDPSLERLFRGAYDRLQRECGKDGSSEDT